MAAPRLLSPVEHLPLIVGPIVSLIFMWLVMRFSTPAKGFRSERVPAPLLPVLGVFLGWSVVGFAGVAIFHSLSLPYRQLSGWVGVAGWFAVFIAIAFWGLRLMNREWGERTALAAEEWERGEAEGMCETVG